MRLIDADAFERRVMFDSEIEDLQDVIYALRDYEPIADAVSVVRCKDCIHKDVPCPLYGGSQFFCAYGERGETNDSR